MTKLTHADAMAQAIDLADACRPEDPARTPKVGAVIVDANSEMIGQGSRGVDRHAEFEAIHSVKDAGRILGATVYTTLEPCTGVVRSKPEEACTNLLLGHHVGKVVIGILDPNQGVCGKGVLALQGANIEVMLFPKELANRIRVINTAFMRAQETLGVEFISPVRGATFARGWHDFRCRCVNAPGDDIHVVVEYAGLLWPQDARFKQVGDSKEYDFRCHFGARGPHQIVILRANDLGTMLIRYHEAVAERYGRFNERMESQQDLAAALVKGGWPGSRPGVPLQKGYPRGLDVQARVELVVE